ncbi:anion permease, partial [[Eubacterium] rectale]|nr:anion permease [Agathobacter rectalis]
MDTLIALSAAVLLPLCGVINWGGIAKNTDWGVLLLFGGGITLSSILVQTGAAGFLADQVSSLAMGQSPIIILLIISLFITSLTEF